MKTTGRLSFLARERAEDGSMMLALLGSILATSVVTTLAVSMLASSGTTRHNQDYTIAIQAADAGIQDAIFRANNGQAVSGATGTVGNSSYSWTATPTTKGWTVVSQGTERSVSRTVEVEITKAPRFFLAAFGDRAVEMRGGNGADSYNSADGSSDTGNGDVGSNGDVTLHGNSTHVDSVTLYNHDAANNTCAHSGGGSCGSASHVGPKLELASDDNMAFITEQLAACASVQTLESWRASTASPPGVLSYNSGVPYCFETMTFDMDTVLSGTDSTHPIVVYVRGAVTVENHVNVNCAGCSATSTPDASQLQIYSAGATDTQAVALDNHSVVAAAIYAPRANCLGNPSNAQAEIFGALVCGALDSQGGWTFHFDDNLSNIGTGGYQVVRYDEQ